MVAKLWVGGRICFQVHPMVVGRNQFLKSCWEKTWLLVLRPPAVPCHIGLSMAQLTMWQLASPERGGERGRNQSFCNYSSARAAITSATGWGLTQQKCIASQLRRLEGHDQGGGRLVPPEGCEGQSVPCPSPRFWWCASNF